MIETETGVIFSPESLIRRQPAAWRGMSAEIVQLSRLEPFEYRRQSSHHLLIATHRGERCDGETLVEGLPRSTRREFNRRLTFVPAGHTFYGCQEPRALARITFFYIDPSGPLFDPELGFPDRDLQPRLFFEDMALWATAEKLTQEIERGDKSDRFYTEALGVVLIAELARLYRVDPATEQWSRGGLSGWQRRAVEEQIEGNIAEPLSLVALAESVRLSPRHFARAFKQSFGQPPHRYHLARRVERAKVLLGRGDLSVTEIAMSLGFADTSAFSTTFRRFSGGTPRDYRRALA